MVGGNPGGTILKPTIHHSVYDITIFQPFLKLSRLGKTSEKTDQKLPEVGGLGVRLPMFVKKTTHVRDNVPWTSNAQVYLIFDREKPKQGVVNVLNIGKSTLFGSC